MVAWQAARRYLGLIIVGLIVAACSAGSGVVPGGVVPEVTVTAVDGKSVSLKELAFGKPTILNMWASWCDPCTRELPALSRLKDSLAKDGVQVVTIGIQDDPASLENALRNSGASFPLYIDKEGQVASRFKIAGVPETFLLNAEGKFVLFDDPTQGPTIRLMGPRDWDDPSFIRRIRAALTK
jgi:thiol-disulfide isomerase/thioredoxin